MEIFTTHFLFTCRRLRIRVQEIAGGHRVKDNVGRKRSALQGKEAAATIAKWAAKGRSLRDRMFTSRAMIFLINRWRSMARARMLPCETTRGKVSRNTLDRMPSPARPQQCTNYMTICGESRDSSLICWSAASPEKKSMALPVDGRRRRIHKSRQSRSR